MLRHITLRNTDRRTCRRRQILSLLLAVGMTLLFITSVSAEDFAQAKPEDLGFHIPDGDPKPGGDRRVQVYEEGKTTVGKVHVEVGDTLIVLLPNGRLTSVKSKEAPETQRPFVPITKDEMEKELEEKFKGFKVRSTRRYTYVYNTSEGFYKATSRILETMYPALYAFVERQKIPVHDPQTPLVAVMFRTKDEFDQYRRMPDGVVAYYNTITNRVIMYEQSGLTEIAPELAVKQSISTIAHEGVHQILHNIGVQKRLSRWPMWISEGLPEYFAPTDIGKRIRWKGVGLTNDLRMYSLIKHLQETNDNRPSGLGVRDTVEARNLDSIGYAKAWALVHYLNKFHRDEFYDYLRAVSKLEPLEEPPADGKLFAQHFDTDFTDHEESMYGHLNKIKYSDPIENQTHYVAMIDSGGFRSVIVTFSPAVVQRWQLQNAGRGAFGVRAFENKATAERFANLWVNGG